MATLNDVKNFFDNIIADADLRSALIADPNLMLTKLMLGLKNGDGTELAVAQEEMANFLISGDQEKLGIFRDRLVELSKVLEAWSAASAAVVYADGCQTPYRGGFASTPTLPSVKLEWISPDEIIRALELAATQPDSRLSQQQFLKKAASRHTPGSKEERSLLLVSDNLG